MAFSDDFTTIHSCNATNDTTNVGGTWTAGRGNATAIQTSSGNGDYTPRFGTDCVEWAGATANQINSVYCPLDSALDLSSDHLYIWFFYAKGKGGAYMDDYNSLQIRLISDTTWSATPTNYVDFYVSGEIDIPSAWSLHVVSGDADDADASGGTFNAASVRFIEVAVDQASANSGGSDNAFALDYLRYGSTVTVTGTETSASLVTNYGIGTEHGVWEPLASLGDAVINKLCKLKIGNGGTGASSLTITGKVIYENQKSDDAKFGWEVDGTGSGAATLTLGTKVSGTGYKFGSSGCQLIQSPKGTGFTRSDFVVTGNNANCNLYGCLVKGFDKVDFGTTGNPDIEVIDCEFDDCNNVDMNSTGCDITRSKIHDSGGTTSLTVDENPTLLEEMSIYNNDNAGMSFVGSITQTNIENIKVINNTNGVQYDTAGTYDMDNFEFAANTTDIDNNSGGSITINALNGSNPSTTSGTVTINNSVTVKVKCITEAGANVSGVRVLVEESPGGTDVISGTTNASGEIFTSYNYSSDQAITGWARKGTSSPYYKQAPVTGTITSTGFDVTLTMVSDE